MILSNTDLYRNKYDIQTLEDNIDFLTIKSLLHTQTLTPMFCVKYIIETDDYLCGDKEEFIDMYYFLNCQPHISKDDIFDAIIEYYKDYTGPINDKPITNSDLCKKKYDLLLIQENLHNLCFNLIIKTQILTLDFCIKHILPGEKPVPSHKYNISPDMNYILKHQPHLRGETAPHAECNEVPTRGM